MAAIDAEDMEDLAENAASWRGARRSGIMLYDQPEIIVADLWPQSLSWDEPSRRALCILRRKAAVSPHVSANPSSPRLWQRRVRVAATLGSLVYTVAVGPPRRIVLHAVRHMASRVRATHDSMHLYATSVHIAALHSSLKGRLLVVCRRPFFGRIVDRPLGVERIS